MRTLLLLLSVSLLTAQAPAPVSAPAQAAEGPGHKPTVKLFVESSSRPTPLPAAKARLVKDRATLKELALALGPGWTSPEESVGILRWFFADGRVLSAWPHRYVDSEILALKPTHGRGQMWWGRS